jgi:hypothetical protein
MRAPDEPPLRALPHTRVEQINSYYCGPATAHMIIEAHAPARSPGQPALGERMTGPDGTNRYTMRSALHAYLGRDYRVRTLNEGEPLTEEQADQLFADVRASVDSGFGAALAVLIPAGGPRPYWIPPADRVIDHWLAVFGYDASGRSLLVADPAAWALNGLARGIGSHWIALSDICGYTKTYVH